MTDVWQAIGKNIAVTLDRPFFIIDGRRSVGGGCINNAYVIESDGRQYFVKLNHAAMADMFEAEAEGLREIAATGAIKVPQPLCWGSVDDSAYLVMEYLALTGDGAAAARALGRGLAAMHRITGAHYGWHINNTIGATPQVNTPGRDWADFWQTQRLGYQLQLAEKNGYGGRLQSSGAQLLLSVPEFFSGYTPAPSLLHGDLWSGNWAAVQDGTPVVFDPAVYYGDRETDLAMTELFGGFPPAFYQSYQADYPLDPGYKVRKTLYNLYHILNHLNLFGSGYQSQAQHMIDTLLAETR